MPAPPELADAPDSPDSVDRVLADWRAARPDLDPAPLATIGRVLVIAQVLTKRVEAALADHQLTLGQFDILATLRRHPEQRLSPGKLLASVVLTSGGMTARLDKLAEMGLVARTADPNDRRGVVVALTAAGRRRIDAATATRFAEAADAVAGLPAAERAALEGLLKLWLGRLAG